MAQRSFFLFGERIMYSPDQLPVTLTGRAGTDTFYCAISGQRNTRLEVAGLIGWCRCMANLACGGYLWDRIVVPSSSLFRSGCLGCCSAMILDGGTHMISDGAAGITGGFRYNNEWLAALTAHALPGSFYSGDALGHLIRGCGC